MGQSKRTERTRPSRRNSAASCAVALLASMISSVGHGTVASADTSSDPTCPELRSGGCNIELVRTAGPFGPAGLRLTPVSRPVFLLGDSLTYGVNLNGFHSDATDHGIDLVVNDGVPGRRIDQGVDTVKAWGELPDNAVVVIALGTNDIFDSRDVVESDIRSLLAEVTASDIIWVDVADDVLGTGNSVNNELWRLAADDERVTIAEWSQWELAHGVQRASDGVHYTGAEYQKRSAFYVEQITQVAFREPRNLNR